MAGNIRGKLLAQDAIDIVLDDKLLAGWVQVSAFTADGASDVVTTEVEAAASVTTEQNDADTGAGILSTGTTPNDATGTAYQNYKVQIRDATTKQPVDDGVGGEVYGILSENIGVWTLTYYKADGTSYASFSTASIDFQFAEVFTAKTLPGTAFLSGPTFGDISEGGAGSHNHDGRYYTETELGSVTPTYGASLIGTDASAIGDDAGAVDTVQGVLEAFQSAINTLQTTVGTLGIPTKLNKAMTASVTAADFAQATASTVAATPTGDGYLKVEVDGLGVEVGDGVKTKTCYFSGDGGTTARVIADIALGDTMHWVGSVAGYELDASDVIDWFYNV